MEMNQQNALNVLIKAVQVAQSKGAYTLDDAELINKAVRTFVPREQPAETPETEEPKEAVK